MEKNKTIFVVHPRGQIFNIPCVPNIADALGRDSSMRVHFIGIRNKIAPAGKFGPGVAELNWLPIRSNRRKESFLVWFCEYTMYALYLLWRDHPSVFFAVGLRGLIVGFVLRFFSRAPLAYYSLEFYPGSKPLWKRIARLVESICLSRVELLIMHDETRLRVYERIMGRHFLNVAYFPNVPLHFESTPEDERAVRKKLNMNPSKKYILYAGGLYPGVPISVCISILDRLGDSWGLILQTHDGHIELEKRAHIDNELSSGRIILSETPLSVKDYNALVSTARIGLALYSTSDENMRYVGLSSGKIASYWAAGVPIIINKIPFYDTICEMYRSGEVFEVADEIPGLIKRIDDDYDAYRRGALDCFATFFEESQYVTKLNEHMSRLIAR